LITLDLDFSDIRTYPPYEYPGFIILRLKKQNKNYVIDYFKKFIGIIKKKKLLMHSGLLMKPG